MKDGIKVIFQASIENKANYLMYSVPKYRGSSINHHGVVSGSPKTKKANLKYRVY